jgi:DNA-binding HxlR family transcriptional regulator
MANRTSATSSKPPVDSGDLLVPAVPIANCPIAASLGVLGRKWTILILRDMAMMKKERFSEILRSTPGLTPRVLSNRLRELEREGMIERAERRKGPNFVRWTLTEKGNDTIPILMRFAAFGSKWYADVVFEDKAPKRLREVYPAWEAQNVERRYP